MGVSSQCCDYSKKYHSHRILASKILPLPLSAGCSSFWVLVMARRPATSGEAVPCPHGLHGSFADGEDKQAAQFTCAAEIPLAAGACLSC